MSELKELLGIEKLDTHNYNAWKINISYHLKYKGLWSAVNGEPADDAEDARALSLIGLTITSHHQQMIADCDTAEAAWDRLADTYEAKCATTKRHHRQRLINMKKGITEPLSKYFSRAKGIWADCRAAGLDTAEEEVVCAVLTGLPADYDTIVTIIEDTEDEITLDNLLPKLMRVEGRLGASQAASASDAYRAFYSKPTYSDYDCRVLDDYSSSTICCTFCRQPGHTEDFCPAKARRMGLRVAPVGIPFGARLAGPTSAFRPSPHRYGQSTVPASRPRGGRPPFIKRPPSPSSMDDRHCEPVVFMIKTAKTTTTTKQWILDSGASRHLTSDISKLSNITTLEEPITLTFANGATGTSTQQGTVLISNPYGTDIQLNEVLYVPEATDNLLSVPYSTSRGIQFGFSDDACDMVWEGTTIATAFKIGGLYVLQEGSNHTSAPEPVLRIRSPTILTSQIPWELRYDAMLTASAAAGDIVGSRDVIPCKANGISSQTSSDMPSLISYSDDDASANEEGTPPPPSPPAAKENSNRYPCQKRNTPTE